MLNESPLPIAEGTALLSFLSSAPSIEAAKGEVSEEIAILNIVFGSKRYAVPSMDFISQELSDVEADLIKISRSHISMGSKATLWHACSERVLSGISGCRILHDAEHMFCIDAISRTILESAARLYAVRLAKDENSYIQNRMDSKPMSDDVFADNGKKMSDTAVIKKMQAHFPGAYNAYDRMSSGIHIDGRSSSRRVFRVMQDDGDRVSMDSEYHMNPDNLASALMMMRHRASCFAAWWVLKDTLLWSKTDP